MAGSGYALPGILRRLDIRFAVQRNVRKGISVQELHRPVEQTDHTLQTAEDNGPHDITVLRS